MPNALVRMPNAYCSIEHAFGRKRIPCGRITNVFGGNPNASARKPKAFGAIENPCCNGPPSPTGRYGAGGYSPAMRVLNCALIGGVIVGGVGFVGGFFGPLIFAPEANQGPLLGIFITGPLGFVVGLLGGAIVGFCKPRQPPVIPRDSGDRAGLR